jgi:phosphoesterase RecJ-like protein
MVVDCPTLSRTGKYINIFEKANDTLVIDHHSTNEYFANNNICLKNASSTCEIIYFIAKTLNCKISDQICKILYSGIITDTANLTQGNITPRTYKVISQIAEREINLNAINEFFFKNDSKEKVMLLERAIHSLRFFCGDRLAIMKLTKEDFNQTGATSEDTYGLINHAINIEGVKIAAIIIEKDEKYFFSLRSKEGINVADIATKFGGGGHDTMAAFQYEGKWGDIKFEFIKACKEKLPAEEENTENIFFDIKPSNEEQNL